MRILLIRLLIIDYAFQPGEKVAVKVQYPDAERLMTRDLRNLRVLAEFLQRAELKFDILSAIKELQRGIKNEFNFDREARNMETMRKGLLKNVPEVTLPRPLWYTKQLIVMTYVEGKNLGKLAAYKSSPADSIATKWVKRQSGKKLFDVLSKAWGEQLFELRMFNADPHPGNICLHSSGVGLLDWVSQELNPKKSMFVRIFNFFLLLIGPSEDRV